MGHCETDGIGRCCVHDHAPTLPPRDPLVDEWARRFHETYERLAPSFGYETRKASAVPWEQVPETNRRLMEAVVGEVLRAFVEERDRTHECSWITTCREAEDRTAKVEASLDEERRLRATACKLADERERELAALKAQQIEVNTWGLQLMDGLGTFLQKVLEGGPQASEIRVSFEDKDCPVVHLWATTDEQEPTARCRLLAGQRDQARAERDRAQERLREAEGLLARIRDGWPLMAAELAKGKPGLAGEIRAFLAPDEQPAAPAAEPTCNDSVNHDHTKSYCAGPWPSEPQPECDDSRCHQGSCSIWRGGVCLCACHRTMSARSPDKGEA